MPEKFGEVCLKTRSDSSGGNPSLRQEVYHSPSQPGLQEFQTLSGGLNEEKSPPLALEYLVLADEVIWGSLGGLILLKEIGHWRPGFENLCWFVLEDVFLCSSQIPAPATK